MRSVTTHDAETAFAALVASAQQEPVAVTRDDGQTSAVLMSYADYQRITGQTRLDLIDVMHRMRTHAAAQGLDEAKLAELLADDS